MPRDIDALTSATLKHLRERWWDGAFTRFLRDNLNPRPGNRILDVGCGAGTAEIGLGFLRLSQVRFIGVDLRVDRLTRALADTRGHNLRVGFAAGDTCRLPFGDGVFDATFSVAVLQHVRDLSQAVGEFARVTRPGGRLLAVEPDNTARYWFSSSDIGTRAFELSARFFAALASARGDSTDPAVGPKLPQVFRRHRIEPLAVELFPVSVAWLGPPPPQVWRARREAVAREIAGAPNEAVRRLGADYLKLIDRYAAEASRADPPFVEIQNTILFATVGQKESSQ